MTNVFENPGQQILGEVGVDQALARPGDMLDISLDSALSSLGEGRLAEAECAAQSVISIDEGHVLARLVLGVVLSRTGRKDLAIAELRKCVRIAPAEAQVRYNLAVVLSEVGEEDLAMVEYAACLELNPNFADALWNYGELLRLREHFQRALDCFDRLLRIEGTKRSKMAHRMAVCCAWLGLDERADGLFSEQIELDDGATTHWEYSHFLLSRGRFTDAWPHYARRFDAGSVISLYRAEYPFEFWKGQYKAETTLVVFGEQGVGDEILFASFLPELLSRAEAAGMRVVIGCRASICSLFQASFPNATVVAHEVSTPVDMELLAEGTSQVWQVMIGDLPLWLPKPQPKSFLTPTPEDVVYMKARLSQRGLFKIGLAWSANPRSVQSNRTQRNADPALLNAMCAHLKALRPHVEFYSLHDPAHRSGLAALADASIKDLSEDLTNFSRTAAAIAEMDAVVTVCTSVANLAGAMNCDTHVLLQRHFDWRWFGETSWFPRTSTYSQIIPRDWSSPMSRVFARLAHITANSSVNFSDANHYE